jgi:hypothetical protein
LTQRHWKTIETIKTLTSVIAIEMMPKIFFI